MKPETINAIKAHYEHAKRKHPKFVDMFFKGSHAGAKEILLMCSYRIKAHIRTDRVDSYDILRCETSEIYEAYTGGRLADAKEECYDAIAVLLRMIDMIEKEESNDKH